MKYQLLLLALLPLLAFSQRKIDPIPNSINQFGLDVCKKLSDTPDYLISPASISVAMGMTYVGAREGTKDEIKKVFHYPNDSEFYNGFEDFIKIFEIDNSQTKIALANKLWADRVGIELRPEFVQKNKQYFRSGLDFVDFKESEKTRKAINSWVADNTESKILELLDENFISSDMVLVLTNALYFKSNWAKKFDPKHTQEDYFFNHEVSALKVSFMSTVGNFNSYEDEYVDVVEIPYEGGEFSFLIVLPKESMNVLESQLTSENFNKWSNWLTYRKFELLKVPKFKVSSKFELKGLLSQLGMKQAFSRANFDGMGHSPYGNITLSKVAHETFLEFNEEGTEASAATAVGAVARSSQPEPKRFIADRPFLYVLKHIDSNAILFIGKMSNPEY